MTVRLLALLILSGCTDHLVIGAVDADDEASAGQPLLDAGYEREPTWRDAGPEQVLPWPEAGYELDAGPLEIALRIFGREDVTSAFAPCGAGCTEVEVVVRGGRPPYDVSWADGMRGARRQMCPGLHSFPLQEVVRVHDSSTQSLVLNPVVPLPGGCSPEVTDGGSWHVCVEPPAGDGVTCGGATWYALREPLEEEQVTLAVSFEVPLFVATSVELYAASEPCGAQTLVATADINAFTPSLSLDTSTRGAPLRWLVLRAPGEAGGRLPAGLRPTFNVCFVR
jgi:hypothetical protein